MKNLILITLLFIAFQGMAQTTKPIDGFLGVKFGSTATQVIDALKAKGGVLVANPDKNDAILTFKNIMLGNRKSTIVIVVFVDDKAFECAIKFIPDLEPQTIDYYNSLVKSINDVYGPGKSQKKFKQPYTDGDGYEITALKTGNANYATFWNDNDNQLIAQISPNKNHELLVSLYYTDTKLEKLNDEKQKAKNKSEF